MFKINIYLFIIFSAIVMVGCQENSDRLVDHNDEIINIAKNFIEALNNETYHEARNDLDTTMQEVLPVETLEELWTELTASVGDFIEIKDSKMTTDGDYRIIYLDGMFENDVVRFQLAFDQQDQIAGFYIL
ncbi:DUF3887 domain-containing protein [Amphibacillus cookii]|uniref:DUF3887 domain-containing protein n=1 Tax=Amphibacillus cookii TaxID=767787 RepID=UPI00195E2CAF|nr:DUF3887 domain-containing protein [Amphibacillus cookii]MBM7541625.1 translation elongation factor EF-Ts [Amphibacillus cookii]